MIANSRAPRWLLRLPADCSIAAIRSVYDLVLDAFRGHDELEIDCSEVSKADVTSVQLLVSTAKTANQQGRPVVLTAMSAVLSTTFQRAGLAADALKDNRLAHESLNKKPTADHNHGHNPDSR